MATGIVVENRRCYLPLDQRVVRAGFWCGNLSPVAVALGVIILQAGVVILRAVEWILYTSGFRITARARVIAWSVLMAATRLNNYMAAVHGDLR
ncbi:hypothetical protein QBC33DRAFT_562417 [Phialemonium atrogriseum]|uniref:Uncharacterized protein n=1 Tax=Phialemonium atrogriseum TaxID=1093897 RepID=A0AAJ0BTR7_9PEZI|nr:uncharacterized protein QBC33DRAFT_562417 [Phialemonium atrogriseum]KAK1763832.1 hypothetical protein QBC33DRAFT_562417 [Phialemonium atrogriseum]